MAEGVYSSGQVDSQNNLVSFSEINFIYFFFSIKINKENCQKNLSYNFTITTDLISTQDLFFFANNLTIFQTSINKKAF